MPIYILSLQSFTKYIVNLTVFALKQKIFGTIWEYIQLKYNNIIGMHKHKTYMAINMYDKSKFESVLLLLLK